MHFWLRGVDQEILSLGEEEIMIYLKGIQSFKTDAETKESAIQAQPGFSPRRWRQNFQIKTSQYYLNSFSMKMATVLFHSEVFLSCLDPFFEFILLTFENEAYPYTISKAKLFY